jgi:hypothetical protein
MIELQLLEHIHKITSMVLRGKGVARTNHLAVLIRATRVRVHEKAVLRRIA